jgi:competence protein ComEA
MFRMSHFIKENKRYILIGIAAIFGFCMYYFLSSNQSSDIVELDHHLEEEKLAESKDIQSEVSTEDEQVENTIREKMIIDVKGAVVKPGVYEASQGERVTDIVNKAGGLLDSADQNQINFAMKVTDEMVLYIPSVGEESGKVVSGGISGTSTLSTEQEEGKVNLNEATETDLQTLPGIGPSKAAAIIEYRETIGLFKTIEDLKEISGIGEKTFEKLKDHISVN